MSNVLLVDTNFSSAPIYDYLVREGHEVFVVGGNPLDALAKSVDNYVRLDYSDLDQTRELVRDLKVDYLVPGCNDQSYRVCVALNEGNRYPGIDSIEASETINNKKMFREFALAHRLPVPQLLGAEQMGTHWPVIVKPVDAYSGRGVTILHQGQGHALAAAMQKASGFSRTQSCLVEDFVEGQLYSHSVFIANQEIVIDLIVEEHGTANPFAVDTSRVVHDFPSLVLQAVRESITTLAQSLNLTDGLIHTQFIRNRDRIWLIEVTRRCPGDLYSQLIELTMGLNYAENYARPFIGQSFRFKPTSETPAWIMRHTLSHPDEQILGAIRFLAPLQIEKLVPISQTGDRLKPSPSGRIAILFARTNTKEELDQLFTQTLGRQLYTIQN